MLQLQLYQQKFFYFRNVGTVVGLSPIFIKPPFLKCRMLRFDPFFTEKSNGKMCPFNLEMLNVKTRPLRIVAE